MVVEVCNIQIEEVMSENGPKKCSKGVESISEIKFSPLEPLDFSKNALFWAKSNLVLRVREAFQLPPNFLPRFF